MKLLHIWVMMLMSLIVCVALVSWMQPMPVSYAATRKVVASKGDFVLGLRDDGSVFCTNLAHTVCALLPADLRNVVDIDAGELHGIALKSDGTVAVWGVLAADDQLNGGNSYAGVSAITNAVAIAGGTQHTLVLLADGTLRCFGNNEGNRCSAGAGLTNVIDIDAADRWSMALLADGRVAVWGKRLMNSVPTSATPFGSGTIDISMSDDFYYQLLDTGMVDVMQASTYGSIESTTNVIGMASGFNQFMALYANGTTACWEVSPSLASCGFDSAPTPVAHVVGVAVGDNLHISQQVDGRVQVLDLGTFSETPIPTERVGGIDALTTGGYALIRRVNGSAFPWGVAQVPTITAWSNIKQLSGYGNTLLGLTSAGTVQSATLSGGTTTYATGGSNVKAVARGRDFSAYLLANGTFTSDLFYDPIDGTTYSGRAKALCAGRNFLFVLSADGAVHYHGAYDPNYGLATIPVTATNVKQIACGENHVIALRGDGTTVGWGNIPNGNSSGTNVRAVAAGGIISVLLYADGTVAARGYDDATFNAFLTNLHNVRSVSVDTYTTPSNTLGVQFVAVHDNGKVSVFGNAATQIPTPYAMTYTRTSTPSRTFTATRTATNTATATRTASNTATATATATATYTRTATATATASRTATDTYTPTSTRTATSTRTLTYTRTATYTRTNTRTYTASRTATDTYTPTNTRTATSTRTLTASRTATNTATDTRTLTPSVTPTTPSGSSYAWWYR